MRIGIDFDNTIVCYDRLFHTLACDRKLIPVDLPVTKRAVRDYLRETGREEDWTELQGIAYGAEMQQAAPFPDAMPFLQRSVRCGWEVFIISHKTQYPYRGPQDDLHAAAIDWLVQQGVFDADGINLPREHVFFSVTKEGKLAQIAQSRCQVFVDDLPEFLAEPAFPEHTERILFDPHDQYRREMRFRRLTSWQQITDVVFGAGGG